MELTHKPVLLNECLEGLNIRPDGIYVDGTLGRAGHSREIARRLTTGRLIAIDRDQAALEAAPMGCPSVFARPCGTSQVREWRAGPASCVKAGTKTAGKTSVSPARVSG